MTVTEFSNEFDIYYNNIASNAAPGIDAYEKSVYLSRAQLEIVNNYFNPKGNKYNKGFEEDSKRRADLRELIRPYISTVESTELDSTDGLSEDSKFFRIPNDVYFIIQEKGRVNKNQICSTTENNNLTEKVYIKVKPITHDEFNRQEKNPFKKPDKEVIWRVDMYSIPSTDVLPGNTIDITKKANKIVELISPYTIDQYKFRYVKYPEPIILVNLNTEYPYENLSIEGETLARTCQLNESVHREILNRAVELALEDYNPERLANKIELNKRNE